MSEEKQVYERIKDIEKRLGNLESYYKNHLTRLHKDSRKANPYKSGINLPDTTCQKAGEDLK